VHGAASPTESDSLFHHTCTLFTYINYHSND